MLPGHVWRRFEEIRELKPRLVAATYDRTLIIEACKSRLSYLEVREYEEGRAVLTQMLQSIANHENPGTRLRIERSIRRAHERAAKLLTEKIEERDRFTLSAQQNLNDGIQSQARWLDNQVGRSRQAVDIAQAGINILEQQERRRA